MKNITIIGDIHCKFGKLIDIINYSNGGMNFIAVGDIGLGYDSYIYDYHRFENINNILKEKNSNLYMIRGNHDNPYYWFYNVFNFSNINLVQDYEILKINDRKILCIGGAISVDRCKNKLNVDYWKDEGVIFDKENISLDRYGITDIVTHTAPLYCNPSNVEHPSLEYLYELDKTLRNDVLKERKYLTEIINRVKRSENVEHHFYGHFHHSKTKNIDGTKHILLNELETFVF